MNVRRRTGRTYSEYQVEKLLEQAEAEFDKQWNEKVEEIQNSTFENVKTDMFAQFMSIAMATLEKYHNFTEEDSVNFYNNCISLMQLMKAKPLGKDFTPQDTINHVKETTGIDLDNSPENTPPTNTIE